MSDRRFRRLGRIFGVGIDREVEDEVRFHLEAQVEDLIAEGWDPEEARAEARRRFGDLDRMQRTMRAAARHRERTMRRTEYLSELGHDLRHTLRRFGRRPGFAVLATIVLGLGIGANVAVFKVVDAALLRPLPFPRGEELVHVWDYQDRGARAPASYPEFRDWEREAEFLDAIAVVYGTVYALRSEAGPEQISAGVVGGDLMEVMGLSPVLGRGFDTGESAAGERVIMIGEGFWRSRYGGAPDVVGRTLELNGEPHVIVGVMPRQATILAQRENQVWLPLVEREWMTRGLHFMRVVGRMRDGLSLERAQSEADAMAAGLIETGVTRHGLQLQGMRDRIVGDSRALLLALAGAVVFLLLIVCTNLANLFLSQSVRRSREFAVRSALGAGRSRLIRQLVTESLVLGLVGGAVGLGLSRLGDQYVRSAAARAATLAPAGGVDVRVVAFTIVLALGTGLVFGLLPALRAGRRDIAGALRTEGAGRIAGVRGGWRSRRVMVGAEVAISVVLLVGAGLMIRSVSKLLNEDVGFDPEGVLTFEIDLPGTRYGEREPRIRFYDELIERLEALPGVTSAAAVSNLPLSGSDVNGSFAIEGRAYPPGEAPHSLKQVATPGYFETMRIPLLRGRSFRPTDRMDGPGVAVISRSTAQEYWPDEDPIGRRIDFSWGPVSGQEIVGVVADVRHLNLDRSDPEGVVYVPQAQFGSSGLTVVVRSSVDPLSLVGAARRAVQAVDPSQPIDEVATLEAVIRGSITGRRTLMMLLAGFAAIALILAAVGVYAVTSQSVATRTREMGVRMAMGAEPGRLLRMVVGEELRVILPGLALGLAGAWALSRTLSASLHEVSATDPMTFGGVALLLGMIASLAAFVPALRAAGMDPTRALRVE